MKTFRRKTNRLLRGDYLGKRWYFVTMCAYRRQPILASADMTELLLANLREQSRRHEFGVYAYCVMPDHLHLELFGLADRSNLSMFVHNLKGITCVPAARLGHPRLWQRSFYDHILRSGDDPDSVAWYIAQNPVRKGLVQSARDWPWSGSWMMDWKHFTRPGGNFVPPWKRPPRNSTDATA